MQIKNDVIHITLIWGALCTVLNDGIRKGNTGFLLVFNSNFISIMHCSRDNDVFLQTGNDVYFILFQTFGTILVFLYFIANWFYIFLNVCVSNV